MTASVKTPGPETEYTTDPSLIYERYGDRVDMVVERRLRQRPSRARSSIDGR
ncbi:MAG: hypothetical protein ACLR8Y_14235 [Alistipes indistinctus]